MWFHPYFTREYPQASQGVLDLRNWQSITKYPIPLDGQWEFFPETFIMNKASTADSNKKSQGLAQVPGSWDSSTPLPRYSFGSYRLQILIDSTKKRKYGIRIPYISSSSEIYVNGKLVAKSGKPAQTKKKYEPSNDPLTVYFPIEKGENVITLVIQAANFDNPRESGISKSIKFGLEEPLKKSIESSTYLVLITIIVYLVHALYSVILFFTGKRDKRFIYFAMMVLCTVLAILIGERLFFEWSSFSFEWDIKIKYLGSIAGGYFVFQCIKQSLRSPFTRRWLTLYDIISGVSAVLVLVLPATYNYHFSIIYKMVMLIPCLLALQILYQTTKQMNKDNIFLLLATLAAVNSLIWLMIVTRLQIYVGPYPFDLIIANICFAIFWFKQYFRLLDESQQLTLKLQIADKQKDEFLRDVAYEMRNPLYGILNVSQAIIEREKQNLKEQSVKDLKLLNHVGQRMTFLLNDLLELEKFKDKRIRLNLTEVSIYHTAEVVLSMIRFMIEEKPISIINRIPENFPKVLADENRVNQIFFSLLHNAVKYTEHGEIAVHASFQDDWAKISIKDTGQGIDESLLNQIFEPYIQGTDHIHDGFGLGLTICKQLVELHGGKMEVKSKKGAGSIFSFTLKLANSTNHEERQSTLAANAQRQSITDEEIPFMHKDKKTEKPDKQRIRILVIDDDPINLQVIKSIFDSDTYHLSVTTSAKQALSVFNAQDWDLMIIDVMMPEMSGFELTARVRQQYSVLELPILLLTTNQRAEDIATGFQVGANDYVIKPVNILELKARVNSLTKLKRTMVEQLRIEAAWLQAQIQPHFILNTFNSIVALSTIDLDRMNELIFELSNYIRLSIDFHNTEQLSPLSSELQLVRSYLYIEKERFGEKIQVVWDLDPHIDMNIYILPLTIQPLVENAVHHGLMKRAKGGEIRISIKDLDKKIGVSIADNGVGIDPHILENILNGKLEGHIGIGLINTDRRLKNFYGHGLNIKSSPGKGTIVSFFIDTGLSHPPMDDQSR